MGLRWGSGLVGGILHRWGRRGVDCVVVRCLGLLVRGPIVQLLDGEKGRY